MSKNIPCICGECPFGAVFNQHCKIYCGIEVDEDEEYILSSGRGDYGPSNPWNAPGMKISDFIR